MAARRRAFTAPREDGLFHTDFDEELCRGPFIAGVCDAPRITEQIRATARQFPPVRRVEVFVNGRTLASALR